MCLIANGKNPLKGRRPIVFDEKGYTTCWKVYRKTEPINCIKGLYPSVYYGSGEVFAGWIKSDRTKTAGKDYSDYFCHYTDFIEINRGIHVYTTLRSARLCLSGSSRNRIMVPVRCHKSQLVGIDREKSQAVFKKVFLKKADYNAAMNEINID